MGSAHIRSQNSPDFGISLILSILLISSNWINLNLLMLVRERYLRARTEIFYWGCRTAVVDRTCPSSGRRLPARICWDLTLQFLTLLSEVEVGCKLSAFVVASEHDYFFGSGYFHGENEEKDLDWKTATIDVISQKYVLGRLGIASDVGF